MLQPERGWRSDDEENMVQINWKRVLAIVEMSQNEVNKSLK